MKKTLLLLAVFASLSFAPVAQACSPAPGWPPTTLENIEQKDVAFIGTVSSIMQDKSMNGEYRITFSVNETYKGEVEETVTVKARSSSAACGYDDGYTTFEKGAVWAIFANGNTADGYTTDSLSLNAKYSSMDAALSAFKALGLTPIEDEGPTMCTMQYAPVCGKDASGNVKTYGNSCMLGADKAEFLYEGECKIEVGSVPTQNLWKGLRNADVTWLQKFLISKASGAAASALASVGPTGYFGTLTTAALAEFQNAHSIAPALGYFGAKTRAAIEAMSVVTPAETATFSGKISAVNTGCFSDGVCSVTVDGKEVILLAGMRINVPPVGTLKGVDSIGDLESMIGEEAEVYAAKTTEGDEDYTLYGNAAYYVKVLD